MSNNGDKQILSSNYIGIVITVLVFSCKNCNFSFHTTVPGLIRRSSGKLIVAKKGRPDIHYQPFSCIKCGSKDIHLFKCLS